MRKMSRDFGTSCRSIGRVVHDDLGLKSLKRRKFHMFTKAIREKRLCIGCGKNIAFRWEIVHDWGGFQPSEWSYHLKQRPRHPGATSIYTKNAKASFSCLQTSGQIFFCPVWCKNQFENLAWTHFGYWSEGFRLKESPPAGCIPIQA